MSELIREIEDAKREYNKAINHLASVINKHADRVQKKHDKQEGAIREDIVAEFEKMLSSLKLHPVGPTPVRYRDARVREATLKQALKAVKKRAPGAAAIAVLTRLMKEGA